MGLNVCVQELINENLNDKTSFTILVLVLKCNFKPLIYLEVKVKCTLSLNWFH